MPHISLDNLHPHPDNANCMTDETMRKLIEHLRESGRYPPIIVRPHPVHAGEYQILDGHHRVLALRELGRTEAHCDVWDVDDEQATMLLLTLNRLHGEDDPAKRGVLIKRLASEISVDDLAKRLPDSVERLRKLMSLAHDAPPPAPPPRVDEMLHAVTFFLTAEQRRALLRKLDAVDRDRATALARLLGLDASSTTT
jgi:ParB family transcriptional regulator, chromosome partitioning protein